MGQNRSQPPFGLPADTSIEGLLGIVICWYWDDDHLMNDATYGVSLIPDLLSGASEYFSDHEWSLFVDALNAFGQRTAPRCRSVAPDGYIALKSLVASSSTLS
jgi:hypothetical protein